MTANELADELEKMIPALPLSVLIKSVTMLRQQQAEIEVLRLRELTDEEINEVFKSIYGHNNSYINSSLFKFARAILKKASEK